MSDLEYVDELVQEDVGGELSYLFLLQNQKNSWYHPILVCILTAIFFLICSTAVAAIVISLFDIDSQALRTLSSGSFDVYKPGNLALLLASVACLIPALFLAHICVYRKSVGWFFSVQKRLRMSWLLWSLVVSLAFLLIPNLLMFSVLSTQDMFSLRSDFLLFFVVLIVLLPFQVAAEELVFRGAIPQYISCFFRSSKRERCHREGSAFLLSACASSLLFTAAHLSQELWVCLQIALYGLCSFVLVYKTGGLESSIAFHAAVNFSTFFAAALTGGNAEILAQTAQTSFYDFLLTAIFYLAITASLLLLFKHFKQQGKLSNTFVSQTPQSRQLVAHENLSSQMSSPFEE